jgi:WXG100 family type VII secretion target
MKEATAMTGIKVSPEQLTQLSANVARGSSDIDAILGSLRSQVSPLAGGDWAGQASAQFSALFEQWQRSARDLNSALQGISTLLANAGASYAQAEQQIAATFQR